MPNKHEEVEPKTFKDGEERTYGGNHDQENLGNPGDGLPKDPVPGVGGEDGAGEGEGSGASGRSGGSANGGRQHHGKPSKQKKPLNGGSKGDESSEVLTVKVKQYSKQNGKREVTGPIDGNSTIKLKSDVVAKAEDAVGRNVIIEAIPTNLEYEKSPWIDFSKDLANLVDRYNLPMVPRESSGRMTKIATMEELIAIPTVPVVGESKIKYPHNSKCDVNNNIVPDDGKDALKPVKAYQLLGQTISFNKAGHGNPEISRIHYVDFTPDNLQGYSTTVVEDTCSDGHYRCLREQRVAYELFQAHQDALDSGIVKSKIFQAPESEGIVQLLMDIERDTIENCARAILCANQFLVSINQDRPDYGIDIKNRFDRIRSQITNVANLRNDAKKFKKVTDIVNMPFIKDTVVDAAQRAFDDYEVKHVYPRTSIMVKQHIQDLLKWTTPSNDHRSSKQRCVLGFTTMFPFSDVTYIDGVKVEEGALGGRISRYYSAFSGRNLTKNYFCYPIFDGINNAFETLEGLNAKHPYLTGTRIPLTFDPNYPEFALLVCYAMSDILNALEKMMSDWYDYLEAKGAKTVSTYHSIESVKLNDFMKAAGYSADDRHMSTSGQVVEVSLTSNQRMRFPETLNYVKEETNDDDSLFEYHPGFYSPFTIACDEVGDRAYFGRLSFPCGKVKSDPVQMVNQLDMVIAINNSDFKTKGLKITANTGSDTPLNWYDHTFKLKGVTVKQWIHARRIRGLVYAVPCGLVPFDSVYHDYTSDAGLDSLFDADTACATYLAEKIGACGKDPVKKSSDDKRKDAVNEEQSLTAPGIQISSYRLSFGIPIDDYAAARCDVSNLSNDDEYLKTCVVSAFARGGYKESNYASEMVKVSDKGVYTTNLRPVHFTDFPFCKTDLQVENAPYSFLHVWSSVARFVMMYTNPFMHIRHSNTLGVNDATPRIIPHQYCTNMLYYWYELSSEYALSKQRSYMKSHKNALEPSIYNGR